MEQDRREENRTEQNRAQHSEIHCQCVHQATSGKSKVKTNYKKYYPGICVKVVQRTKKCWLKLKGRTNPRVIVMKQENNIIQQKMASFDINSNCSM